MSRCRTSPTRNAFRPTGLRRTDASPISRPLPRPDAFHRRSRCRALRLDALARVVFHTPSSNTKHRLSTSAAQHDPRSHPRVSGLQRAFRPLNKTPRRVPRQTAAEPRCPVLLVIARFRTNGRHPLSPSRRPCSWEATSHEPRRSRLRLPPQPAKGRPSEQNQMPSTGPPEHGSHRSCVARVWLPRRRFQPPLPRCLFYPSPAAS